MTVSVEKGRTKQILCALWVWLLSAAMMLLGADLLIGRMKLGSNWISAAAAAVILISSAAASFVLFRGKKGSRSLMPALLLWIVTASVLLMLGFLINCDTMSLSGLVRVLLSSLVGSLSGTLFQRTEKRKTRTGKFVRGK